MGNTRNTGYLQNVITVSDTGNIAFMSGSTMLMSLSNTGQMSGSVPVLAASTASFVATAQTASFVALAQSASNAVSAQTASFANTFTVGSTLTAQTLVVQTITSSVDFVTGSTRFGSILGNTHVFSGSVTMNPGGLFVSSSGFVGIGTTSPSSTFHVRGIFGAPSTTGNSLNGVVRFGQTSGFGGLDIGFGDPYSWLQSRNATDYSVNYNLSLQPNGGNVGIGTTNPLSTLVVNANNTGGRGGEISIINIGGSTIGSEVALNFGFGASSYNLDNGNAQIKAVYTGASEATDIVFSNWNGTAWNERMRIASGGNVGIGINSPTDKLDISGVLRVVMPSDPLTGAITAKILSFSPSPFGLVFRGYETGAHSIQSQREANNAQLYALSLQPLGGNVGIGTTTPGVSLDLSSRTDAIRLTNGTTAQRPTAATGQIRYNTSLAEVEVNNGSGWGSLQTKVMLGSSPSNPAESANDIKTYYPNATNGFYWIRQTGSTAVSAYCVFKDFTGADIQGGPWTVPIISNDANSNFSTNGSAALATFLSKCQAIGINTPGRGMEGNRTATEVYGAWLAVKRTIWEAYTPFVSNGNTNAGAVLRMPIININGEGGTSDFRLVYNTGLGTTLPPNESGDACNANQLFCGWWAATDTSSWRTNNNTVPGPEDWGPSDQVNTAYNGAGVNSVLTVCVYK